MQQMSSKKYEQLLRASEVFDGHCHQFTQEDSELLASDEVKLHLKNWSLIRSSLRNELPQQVDLNFADKVMAKIAQEEQAPVALDTSDLSSMLVSREAFNAPLAKQEVNEQLAKDSAFDQSTIDQDLPKKTKRLHFSFKRLGVWSSQVAVAATVAALSVIGFQTYNASEPVLDSVATAEIGFSSSPINGISLASYQNADSESMIKMGQIPDFSNKFVPNPDAYQADIRQKQQEEIEKINQYIQGYVLNTAGNY